MGMVIYIYRCRYGCGMMWIQTRLILYKKMGVLYRELWASFKGVGADIRQVFR